MCLVGDRGCSSAAGGSGVALDGREDVGRVAEFGDVASDGLGAAARATAGAAGGRAARCERLGGRKEEVMKGTWAEEHCILNHAFHILNY